MSRRIAVPYKDVKVRIVGPTGEFFAHRVQKMDFPTNMPSTTINELGNKRHAGVVTDVPEVTATFNAFDVSHKIFAYMCGENPSSYATGAWDDDLAKGAGGVDVSNLKYCDLIGYIREEDVAEHLKCIHAKYLRVTDFTFTYSVGAESTEEYTTGGSEKRYFKYDVVVDTGNLAGGNFTITYTPNTLKNGDELLSCIVDGDWKIEGEEYSVAGKVVSVSGATTEGILCVYHTASGVLSWNYISDATVPVAIRGKNVPVEIQASDTTWEHQYRVQSVSIRGTFPNTKVMEMGNTTVVGYVVDPPDVTGDINVLDVDNETIALFATGYKSGNGEDEYGVDEYEERTLALKIQVLDPTDNVTVQKAIVIPKMRITSEGTTANVGGQLTQTFSFASDDARCIVYSGAPAYIPS